MADTGHLHNVAIVGASGNVGSSILTALLAHPHPFNITIVTRSESSATFPSSSKITVKKGDLNDASFLTSAFKGAEAAIFALSHAAQQNHDFMVDCAVKAGVKWIIPNEWAGDGLNEKMMSGVPIFQPKKAVRAHVEELAKKEGNRDVKWVGVATNPFFEMCFQRHLFGVNAQEKTAMIYPDAGKFNVTTIPRIGRGVAALLALPLHNTEDKRASLEYYGNNFLYLSSFHITQTELLRMTQKVTGTNDSDWKIDRGRTIEKWLADCSEGMKKGDMKALFGLTFAYYMGEGLGGDYEHKAAEDRKVLGLEKEDFEDTVRHAVEDVRFQPVQIPSSK